MNVKIRVIKSLPFNEMRAIEQSMSSLGWDCEIIDNGNFVFEKGV